MKKSLLGKAIALAAEVFKDKTDRGGNPYILHCLRVMDKVKSHGEVAQIAAVLHDVVEDTDIPLKRIYDEFGEEAGMLVSILTHRKADDYLSEYIKRIAMDRKATAIKMGDLEDNSNITRLKGLGKKDFDRLEKYHRAYVYLKDAHD